MNDGNSLARVWARTLLAAGALVATAGMGCKQVGPPTAASPGASKASAKEPLLARPGAKLQSQASQRPIAKVKIPASAPKRVAPRTDRTTSGAIAAKNLDASINALVRSGASKPQGIALLPKLVSSRLLRSQFIGTAGDLVAADAETAAAVQAKPKQASLWLLRAKVQAAVHRWADALKSVAKARELGADVAKVDALTMRYRGAMGDMKATKAILESARADAKARPSYATYAALGTALTQLGKFEEADAAYVKAQGAYRDVSPFPRAWIDFQRGVMWAERAGKSERALALYEAAVKRLPLYHTAVVHLSEMLVEAGETKRAITLLEPIAERALTGDGVMDPEAAGTLGELLAESADPAVKAKGAKLLALAKANYEQLLGKLPEAFSDHGAEFFVARGDFERASQLAQANLKVRQTARAYDLAIRVHAEASQNAQACVLAKQAVVWSPYHPVLGETLSATRKAGCQWTAAPTPTSDG